MQLYLSRPMRFLDPAIERPSNFDAIVYTDADPRWRILPAGRYVIDTERNPYRNLPSGEQEIGDWYMVSGHAVGLPTTMLKSGTIIPEVLAWEMVGEEAREIAVASTGMFLYDVDRPRKSADGDDPRLTLVPAGVYEIAVIDNPYGHNAPWTVLKGTRIGAAKMAFEQAAFAIYTRGTHEHSHPDA